MRGLCICLGSWAVKSEGFVYLFGDVAGGRVPGGNKVRGLVTDTK